MDKLNIEPDPGMTPDEYLEKLILLGVVEVAGIDSDGDFTFSFTDKIKEIGEDFKQQIDDLFMQEVTGLWERGFLDMNITEKNPVVKLTPIALDEASRDRLPRNLKNTLEYIISILKI